VVVEDSSLDVEYDLVAIVDGLPRDEREEYQISNNLMDFLAASGVQQQCAGCGNKAGLIRALQHFLHRANNGDLFCLHFVCHGNERGLGLKATGEFIGWDEFRYALGDINKAMGNRLIVNMSSCRGLHGIRIVDANSETLPFFGLVGPSDDLSIDDAKKMNMKYYELQLAGKEIQDAVSEINSIYSREMLYAINSRTYRHAQLKQGGGGEGETLSF